MVSVGQDGLSANQVSPHGVMLVQFHADLLPFWWGFRRGCSIRPTLSKGFLNECAIEIAIFSYLRGEKMYQFHWNKLKWFNSSQNEILGVGSQFSQISKIACSEWMYEEIFFQKYESFS